MKTITDKATIQEVMRAYMLRLKEQSASFLFEIRVAPGADWNGIKVGAGGLIIEGARPFSSITHCDTGDVVYNVTNSDSGYTRTIGQVRLADIQSITTLH